MNAAVPDFAGDLMIFVDGYGQDDHRCWGLNEPDEYFWVDRGWAVGDNERGRYCSRRAVDKIRKEEGVKHRFSPARLHAQRVRLGLSAADMGRLIGVSQKSIYDWERGSSRPREKQLALIAAVRKMGKREAKARLGEIAVKS